MATHYAVIQASTGTVYGIGPTPEQAEHDAARWIEEDGADGSDVSVQDSLTVVPCTETAAAHVDRHGGHPSDRLTVTDRGVCLRSEEE